MESVDVIVGGIEVMGNIHIRIYGILVGIGGEIIDDIQTESLARFDAQGRATNHALIGPGRNHFPPTVLEAIWQTRLVSRVPLVDFNTWG